MKLFEESKGPSYTRLDDDVSFQILRTNPKLTTNTKLLYDGENLYMESYDAAPILSTVQYKHHRVWKTGLFNRDIRNFLLGCNTAAYEVGHAVEDTIMLDNFDNQFENMYWCGVESVNSDRYPQEMGCIAPLYLRKKRPNYFVIFKLAKPTNTPTGPNGEVKPVDRDFYNDVMSQAKIVKAFDLREGTPIGDYIKRYVEQRDFQYDRSIYVNFSSHEIYYYGIDKKSGVLAEKVENIEDQMLDNDNTVLRSDDWITCGFERNNLIFPYIINLEFLFDDNDIDEYRFARYFGMYCNDIDLYDLDVSNCVYDKEKRTTTVIAKYGSEDAIETSTKQFYYIKDKYKNIFSAKSLVGLPGFFQVPGKLKEDDFKGYEASSISTYVERMEGIGYAFMIFEINEELTDTAEITVYSKVETYSNTNHNEGNLPDEIEKYLVGRFSATNNYDEGEYYNSKFSVKGSVVSQAKAIADAFKYSDNGQFSWLTAYNIGNKVVVRAFYPGAHLNNMFSISFDGFSNNKITWIQEDFVGGTDTNGCMFKVYTADKDMFFDKPDENGVAYDRDETRYFKCGYGRTNAEILAVVPYITDDKKIHDTYSVVITDKNGPYVNVSKTEQAEIIDKYYPRIGVLSMFPVRDFDFDTVFSAYGEYSMMKKEIEDLDKKIYGNADTDTGESDYIAPKRVLENMPYGRFYYYNDIKIDNEYAYYVENVLPELSTVSKSVPYINKWGYIDESKDSCENPYRLNTSKIFEACNFSANTFMQKGDIMEYTMSMPYYVTTKTFNGETINEYQYLPKLNTIWGGSYENIVKYFTKKKSSGDPDPFDEIFLVLYTSSLDVCKHPERVEP